MIKPRLFIISARNLLNSHWLTRGNSLSLKKEYSVFPPNYIKPTFRKDEQEKLFQSKEIKEIAHKQVKPAIMDETCSEFYDARVLKFVNTLMKHGNKNLAIVLVNKTFEGIKRIQLQRYHKAKTDEEKNEIELNPFTVFHKAVDNCTPILHVIPHKKGGITYQIPVPIRPIMAQHKAMLWLIEAANEKKYNIRFYDVLAKELVTASQNQGSAVAWKQELHKKCQANRSYAHFRWI